MGHKKTGILFLCTGNACRSQMAEGWTRFLKGDRFDAWSAGIKTHGLDPYAVQVMAEAGVDISHQKSTHVRELMDYPFDYVVTLCDHARESCPLFPRPVIHIHRSFDDPPFLAASAVSEAEVLDIYRRVRDEIRSYIETLPEQISAAGGDGTP